MDAHSQFCRHRIVEADHLVLAPGAYEYVPPFPGWTLPGVMTGAFLTFVLCIGDYITPQILGGNNELSLPQLIMLQLGRRGDFV